MNENLKKAFAEFIKNEPQTIAIERELIKKLAMKWNIEQTELHDLIREWTLKGMD